MGGSIFLFSFVAIAGRNHLMDFGWAIALLVALAPDIFLRRLAAILI